MTKARRCAYTCFLALMACGAYILLSGLHPALRRAYRWLGPERPTYLGHNMATWLQMLTLKTNSHGDPLQIVEITCNTASNTATAEVQLSYDLLSKHGFLDEKFATFHLDINGDILFAASWRGSNGDCLLPFDTRSLNPGTNQVRVRFVISNRTNTDFIMATGPARELVWTNGAGQHP